MIRRAIAGGRVRCMRVLVVSIVSALVLFAGAATAVIIDSGDGSGNIDPPPGFPWWAHVDQRLGGTTIIYLGNGWVLTARHVGMGSLLFGGERYEPDPSTAVYFGDPDRPADLIAFRLVEGKPWPGVPLLPIAETSPAHGEEVLMIGNGHNRGERFRGRQKGREVPIGWMWGPGTKKRWGTNRVDQVERVVDHGDTYTRAFATRFESLFMGRVTEHEAQAAIGDSGGAVFKRRDPADPESEWVLAGVMFTVNHPNGGPNEAALYGDLTHSIDLATYRDELIGAVRPQCANERDDDGDGLIDHPADGDCESAFDVDEGSSVGPVSVPVRIQVAAIVSATLLALAILARTLRPRR